MDKSDVNHYCEVCYIQHLQSDLLEVKEITYKTWKRASPWYICQECAEKISTALKEKEGKNK